MTPGMARIPIRASGSARRAAVVLLATAMAFSAWSCTPDAVTEGPSTEIGRYGGQLVSTLRAETKTLNPILAINQESRTVIDRLNADLIHINQLTHEVEPALAESWEMSTDGRTFELHLRRDVLFSDGEPFDADDVVFTFQVHLDEGVASAQRDLLMPEGSPVLIEKINSHTVRVTLEKALAVGDRIFDLIGILPEHLLRTAYDNNTLTQVWGIDTSPEEIAGLGPFRLREFRPGDRVILERNPHYWKKDSDGNALPYLDELVFLFLPSDDAQVLSFQSGDSHVIDTPSAENYAVLERSGADFEMRDAGPSMRRELFVFNMNDLSERNLPEIVDRQRWFRAREFRRAIAKAIDLEGIINLVYQGRASAMPSNVSPGNKRWLNESIPKPERDLEQARTLLRGAGFHWDGADLLLDPDGNRVSFSIMVASSNSNRMKTAAILEQDFVDLGIEIEIRPVDQPTLLKRLLDTLEYDTALLGLGGADPDPNPQIPLLKSSGRLHLWNTNESEPLSDWQREIDTLMDAQLIELDFSTRKQLYDRVQEIMYENQPIICLVSVNILTGASRRVGNFKPALLQHYTLWNDYELFLKE